MSPAEVSVLLPVHVAGPEFSDAILSVVHQTEVNQELILVLNCPDQATATLARTLAHEHPLIRLIDEPRKGIHYALHTGLLHCTAPFIARMDADDISLPSRLRTQLDILLRQPDIDLLGCRVTLPDSPHNEGFRTFVQWQNNILSPHEHLSHAFHESPVAHPSVMFRRSCIQRWGSYTLDTNIPEDYELWLRWLTHGARFCKTPEYLLIWNDTPGRLSRNHPSYNLEAFDRVRYPYAASFLSRLKKKWWVCGGSRMSKRKMDALQKHGLEIAGVIDVVPRKISGLPFVIATDFAPLPGTGVLNLLSGRDQRDQVAAFLTSFNLKEGTDWFTIG